MYQRYKAKPEAVRGQTVIIKHERRYENGHEIIDVSLLRTIPDDEFMKYRNVGKTTIEKIREIRKSLEWV